MAWTDPKTWAVKEKVTAALMNTHLRDNLNALREPPMASVTRTSTLSIPHNTDTTIVWQTEEFDTDTMVDLGSNNTRITCKTVGKYLVVAHLFSDITAPMVLWGSLGKNGAIQNKYTTAHIDAGLNYPEIAVPIVAIFDLIVNDYIELVAWQNSGVSKTIPSYVRMSMVRQG